MKVTVKEVVNYKGHSIKSNGSVDLSFNAMYDQAIESMKALQMLNNDVKITAKLPDQKPFVIGMFRIKSISFDGDGESVLKFNSINDYVELDNMNSLITSDKFTIRMESNVEVESEDEEEE